MGAGRWGHLDRVGNVQDFVLDSGFARSALPKTCTDCAHLDES
jgi:hypothetical protein